MNYMKWWLPILLFILITPFTPYLDLGITQYFYHLGGNKFISNDLTAFFYDYGVLVGDIFILVAILLYGLSFFKSSLKNWRKPALVYLLTLAVGGGVIVHAILKDHWGRPRPKQVIEFGGQQEFRPFYKPNFFDQPEPSKSFTCGHCVMGFCFFAFIVSGRRMRNKPLEYLGWFLTLSLGLSLSLVRMAQGGHFFSDVIASALVMWLTAITFDWLLYPEKG